MFTYSHILCISYLGAEKENSKQDYDLRPSDYFVWMVALDNESL